MKNNSGQTNIFLLFFFPILLIFVFSNIKIWNLGNTKISHQQKLDAIAMHLASKQTLALNAIAAYNQGLTVARRRSYAVAMAMLALRLCALSTLNPKCVQAWSKLEPATMKFFRKLQKLVDHMAKKQDQIITWAEDLPGRYQLQYPNLTIYPDPEVFKLHLGRNSESTCGKVEQDQNCFGKQSDLIRCKTRPIFYNATSKTIIIPSSSKHDRAQVSYKNLSSGVIREKRFSSHQKAISIPLTVTEGKQSFYFYSGTWHQCVSFNETLEKLSGGILSRVNIPNPYLLRSTFFDQGNFFSLGVFHKVEPHSKLDLYLAPKSRGKLWVFSEVSILGADLHQMEFSPKLAPVAHKEDLLRLIQKSHGYFQTPSERGLNEIFH